MEVSETKKDVKTSRPSKVSHTNLFHDAYIAFSTIVTMVLLTLVFFGVCYLKNWGVQIVQNVEMQTISPMVGK